MPDETVRRGRELYYGLAEWADNEIGKVLAALRSHQGIAENTIVIYSSDHGENMGEHGCGGRTACLSRPAEFRL